MTKQNIIIALQTIFIFTLIISLFFYILFNGYLNEPYDLIVGLLSSIVALIVGVGAFKHE